MKFLSLFLSILTTAHARYEPFDTLSVCRDAQAENATQKWSPQSKYWRHLLKELSGLDDGHGEHFEDMQTCVQTALSKSNDDMLQEKAAVPTIIDTLKDGKNRTILVEIGNAITPSQVQAVKRLSACTRRYFPKSRFEHRDFGENVTGGNDCTFLNILLQIFLPDVFENVVNIAELAYETAGWGKQLRLLQPSKCGLRTSEYLNYVQFKQLGSHLDDGSLFTALFALSNPKLYQGGEFHILPRNEPDDRRYYFKPQQYSAIVFLSGTYHGVTDLVGPREMFTNEFWVYDDAPWDGSKRAGNAEMDVFVQRVEESLDHSVDYYKMEDMANLWPDGDEVESFDGYDIDGNGYYVEDEDEDVLDAQEDETTKMS
jgi:hypothetical protein